MPVGSSTITQREIAMADKLLDKAPTILSQIDESFIITDRGHSVRQMPLFRPEEISLGKVLGVGGFGIVNEISKITLDLSEYDDDDDSDDNDNDKEDDEEEDKDKQKQPAVPQENGDKNGDNNGDNTTSDTNNTSNDDENGNGNGDGEDQQKEEKEVTIDPAATTTKKLSSKIDHSLRLSNASVNTATSAASMDMSHHNDQFHYEITKARHVMSRRAVRNGVCRYAIKRLHTSDLSQLEKARGMVDLAVEAKFLSIIWHPNIIKMRGMSNGPMIDRDFNFFIILDRLFITLDQKINDWYRSNKKYQGKFLGFGKKKRALHNLMLDRLTVAYDLAAAFFYLHENRLVYRDIKPENIGFDVRGDVKVFDFGLCKSLSPSLKAREGGYGYRLTGRAGSLPYMAPEVIQMKTYDTKCDVYSYSILLWEVLCLQQAFKGMSPSKFVEEVVVKKTRLQVPNTIPPLTRLMIPEAWDDDPRKRPDMKRVAILIRGDLNDMSSDESILHRTNHMDNRSNHSSHGVSLKSMGGPPPPNHHLEHVDNPDDE